jgi:TonB family protein
MPTSPQVAASDARLGQIVFIDATGTPLGRYRERIDEEIRALWLASDLSLHDRALGLQGDTTISFRVVQGGRVEDKRIERSSGHHALDGIALAAIPDKLPRIPRDVDAEVVYHRYTFRYRNPLITQSAP